MLLQPLLLTWKKILVLFFGLELDHHSRQRSKKTDIFSLLFAWDLGVPGRGGGGGGVTERTVQ